MRRAARARDLAQRIANCSPHCGAHCSELHQGVIELPRKTKGGLGWKRLPLSLPASGYPVSTATVRATAALCVQRGIRVSPSPRSNRRRPLPGIPQVVTQGQENASISD